MDRGKRTLRAEELAGDVQGLASYDDDLLAVEQLLGDSGGQATEKVPLAVDDLRTLLALLFCDFEGAGGIRRMGSVVAAASALLWRRGLAQQGRTYDDRLECRHGCDMLWLVVAGWEAEETESMCSMCPSLKGRHASLSVMG